MTRRGAVKREGSDVQRSLNNAMEPVQWCFFDGSFPA